MTDCPEDLVYVGEGFPGFVRKKIGKGFAYLDKKGEKIAKKRVLERIEQLVIPPMWRDVWICKNAKGHLQVTGFDARGRKQYIYHPDWTAFRQDSKYGRLEKFGKKLPQIRKAVERDLRKKGWPREKILALTVMMLDEYFIRIGNKYYEHENKTYGLTTLRRKHIVEEDGKLYLHFKAKSGKDRKIKVESRRLINLIKKMSELPGYEIFKYQDSEGTYHRLQSQDVNQYLAEISGEPFTAKDFRTWGGTVSALDHFQESLEIVKEFPNRKLDVTIIKKVAEVLGNTTAVCRKYYIHPKVMQVLLEGKLERFEKRKLRGVRDPDQLTANEQTAIKILAAKF
ncbi:DNA topoisomerase IB [Algoriphagus jejuensis]|uniref:DNA topoisomerase n=1 Tax=Algoriphagus jejuensis TaxID=419934 RepID=A0ABN1N292_9BACT